MKTEPIIEYQRVNYQFGSIKALQDLNLEVPCGCIYALLGANGAGKSTTIKVLLNLITPSAGTMRIMGVDSLQLGPREFRKIGYVSENQNLPNHLTLRELIDYCRGLYPDWDEDFCGTLQRLFDIPMDRKIQTFSRGMKIKTAFLISLAYRPSLLILDEPFSGLDIMVRDELIQAILELSDQENWTVFFSSHDMDEVERLADWVGFMDHGRLRISEPLETLRARFRRVDVTMKDTVGLPSFLPESYLLPEAAGSRVRWIASRYEGESQTAAEIQRLFPDTIAFATSPLSLREILLAVARSLRPQAPSIL